MIRRVSLLLLLLAGVTAVFLGTKTSAQSGLKVSYGTNGIQQLSYSGVTLEDLDVYPSDAFHIWHMKATDLSGNVLTTGQFGWGESNNGRLWNAATQTWTYNFTWGSISVQFVQAADTLNMVVTTTNLANSGAIIDGAVIYPLALHFPTLPSGFMNATYPQLAYNTTAPSVTVADYGSGEVVAVVPDASKPVYSGFLPGSPANAYVPLMSGTSPDSLATFLPHNDRPVAPGQTDTYTVSLRFAPSGTATGSLAADAYASWASTWPAQLNWKDRRILGTMYLASSPTGSDATQPGGFPTNPRRYFNDASVDVTTPAGLAAFQARVLQQAAMNVTNLQRLKAQGGITWDIEGEQYPQETSYVCSPDQIATVAPEMESVIQSAGSPYNGMKLDDAYFKTMTDAGFRVGVCIRPQHFTFGSGGTASQVYLPDAQIVAQIVGKMKYAHDRWGATIFYLDTTVETNGAVLDASLFQQAAAALPDSLLIPEETTPKYYAYTAAFKTFLFHGDLGTDPSVYNFYPNAFSANMVNDVAAGTLAAAIPQLTASVQHGDILMVHADYWQANNDTVMQIYASAGAGGGSATTGSNGGSTTTTGDGSGSTSTTGASSGGSASTSTGSDGSTSTGSSGTGATSPASGGSGSSSSGSGATGTGSTTTSTPVVTAPVVTTPPANPISSDGVTILTPAVSQTVAGAISVTGEIDVQLDAAGSHLMVDGQTVPHTQVGSTPFVYPLDTTTLSDGQHTLQLWAHDTRNETLLSMEVTITVANAAAAAATGSGSGSTQSGGASSSGDGTGSATGGSSSAAVGSGSGSGTGTGTASSTSSGAGSSGTSGSGTGTGAAGSTSSSGTTSAGIAPPSNLPVTLTYPLSGQGVSGTVAVSAAITPGLDAQGSYLMVDGVEVGTVRVTNGPYLYPLDTSTLSSGTHTLQIWAHDLNNSVQLSNVAQITVN